MEIYDRIRVICKEQKMSVRELERRANISVGAIAKWKTSRPSDQTIRPVAQVLGVSIDYLLGYTDTMVSDELWNSMMENKRREAHYCDSLAESKSLSIPVLGVVQAGVPIESVENIIGYEDIPEGWAYLGEFFGLQVRGNSMSTKIQEGDIVIVRKQEDAESGDVVVALVGDDYEATIKKLSVSGTSRTLVPYNSDYDPIVESDSTKITIIGKVVEMRRKF